MQKSSLFIKISIVSVLVLNFTFGLRAQNNWGLFPVYSQEGKITEKLHYNVFLFSAINLNMSNDKWFMFYDENTLIYKFTERLSVAGSYTFQRSNVLSTFATNENRLWQQVQYEHAVSDQLSLKHRLRFDERFIQGEAFSHRLRYLIGFKYVVSDRLYWSGYNEFFMKTSTPRSTVYGENWAFFGLGIKTSDNTSLDVGPTYITWVTNDALERLHLWYMQVQFNAKINLKRK